MKGVTPGRGKKFPFPAYFRLQAEGEVTPRRGFCALYFVFRCSLLVARCSLFVLLAGISGRAFAQKAPVQKFKVKPAATPQKRTTNNEQRATKHFDSLLAAAPEKLEWYAKVKNLPTPFRIKNRDSYEHDLECTYVLGRDAKGRLAFAMTETYGPWGEYTNEQKHYFDTQTGMLRLYEYHSAFFGSRCLHNDILRESRRWHYDAKGKFLKQELILTSPEGKKMDSLRCDFPWREEIKVSLDTLKWKGERGL